MSTALRIILLGLMSAALLFGFLHLFVPGATQYNFERLHIFLFNLCSGGTVLIYFSESKPMLSTKGRLFLILAVAYAIFAFAKLYLAAVIIAFSLAVIVDSVRVKKFSLFPINFFKQDAPVSQKFHQASLLCLSMGLVISALVILNNEYFKIISFPKLKLDTFFLGFSFPISLITLAVMFSFMKGDFSKSILRLKNVGFWIVNLGVIIFFLFILYEKFVPQLMVTTILFLSVVLIYYLYTKLGVRVQQKNFLTSGMFFLWYTAVTGIVYIILASSSAYTPENAKLLMRMHSFAALYGWNLSGLAVICRKDDFPIRLHSKTIIVVHWITVIFFAPLGTYYWPFTACTIICYVFILYMMLFSKAMPKSII
ncbi:MAG: hypothetical protein SWH54_07760 [Thermodesulfobacteriota bacterium]|nr:hypothetical protein [Thermodesulfobacteriota bacterium]